MSWFSFQWFYVNYCKLFLSCSNLSTCLILFYFEYQPILLISGRSGRVFGFTAGQISFGNIASESLDLGRGKFISYYLETTYVWRFFGVGQISFGKSYLIFFVLILTSFATFSFCEISSANWANLLWHFGVVIDSNYPCWANLLWH